MRKLVTAMLACMLTTTAIARADVAPGTPWHILVLIQATSGEAGVPGPAHGVHIGQLVGRTSGEAGVPGPALDDSDDDRSMDAEAQDASICGAPDECMPELCGDLDSVSPEPVQLRLAEHIDPPNEPSTGSGRLVASNSPEHAAFAAAALECDMAWASLAQAFGTLATSWQEAQFRPRSFTACVTPPSPPPLPPQGSGGPAPVDAMVNNEPEFVPLRVGPAATTSGSASQEAMPPFKRRVPPRRPPRIKWCSTQTTPARAFLW